MGKQTKEWQTLFLGSKITTDGDRSHEIKRHLAPWKKSYDQPRQHIKKQRHHLADKGLYSQSYSFSSNHVWMWELDHKESWVPKNWCFHIPQAMRQSQEKSYILYNPILQNYRKRKLISSDTEKISVRCPWGKGKIKVGRGFRETWINFERAMNIFIFFLTKFHR